MRPQLVPCTRPPRGWRCDFGLGHDGPCHPQPRWWNVSGRWAQMCHNGHRFEPGIDVDMTAEGRSPDPRWCNVCGEVREVSL